MRIIRISETLAGTPMVEVDPAPLDSANTPYVSYELAALLKPHLIDRDNIAVRFMGEGLPTTATAVVTEMYVKVAGAVESIRWYSARVMIFETPTGNTGMNAYFQPVRMEIPKVSTAQLINNAPVYNFREVYTDMEDSSNDMERLLLLADSNYTRAAPSSPRKTLNSPPLTTQSWWKRFF
jgi:hypothetical protein